mmetsp:Transcript_140715/g.449849  ORF Transcript_140715/g.449849 Transcript_140715/m.449849 type:complete len:205 (+) Transcript_140715:523-1137(+)
MVAGVDEVEERVVLAMLEGELALEHVPRVGLPKHCMAEARNHLAGLEGLLDVVDDELLSDLLVSQLFLHFQEPAKALLIGQPVQRARKTAEARGPRVVGVAEGRAYEVSGVRGDVAALMVRMQHQVQAGALLELLAVVHAKHGREVAGPVELRVVGRHDAVLEGAAVDVRGDDGHLGHQVEGILQSPLPVLILLHAIVVLCRKL